MEKLQYVFWKDCNSIYTGCNHEFTVLAGIDSAKDIIGLSDFDLPWTRRLAEEYRLKDQAVITSGEPIVQKEKHILSAQGHELIININILPIFDADEKVTGILGIFTDISEQKRRERLLRSDKEKALEQYRAMRLLASSIAHELRTPLCGISLGSQGIQQILPTLIDGYQLAEQRNLLEKKLPKRKFNILNQVLTNIIHEVRSANVFIDMLLMKVGPQYLSKQQINTCSITNCIDSALQRYPLTLEEKQLVQLEKTDDFEFMGDELTIIHVLFNLIKNALYHTKAASKGHISIWLEQHKEYNELHFKDTGTGIDKLKLPRIFDEFFSDTSEGAGIGLAFCKMSMENINGQIHCRTEKGEYTEFILLFPVIDQT